MGDEKTDIGCTPEIATIGGSENGAAIGISKKTMCEERMNYFLRDNCRVIYELAIERRELCDKILNLTNAIKANPEEVSFEQKALWKVQHDAMIVYKNVLDKRIISLIKACENDYHLYDEPEKA